MVGAGAAALVGIEEIRVGDLVWARCDVTGHEGFKPVVEVYVREAEALVHLSYTAGSGVETLVGTDEHPFWSLTRNGWVDMGDLQPGERLSLGGPASQTGGYAEVTGLKVELAPRVAGGTTGTLGTPANTNGLFTVYNFQVQGYHTYFAAPKADKPFVWVHNANYGNATNLPVIQRGTQQWDDAVSSMKAGGSSHFRVRTASDAKALLKAGRGNMNRYKRYTTKKYNKGHEMHPSEADSPNAPQNDLPHIKWKDWHSPTAPGKGHIFFNVPN